MDSEASARPSLPPLLYEPLVRRALEEDLGGLGDLTTDALVPTDLVVEGRIVARVSGRIAGLEVAAASFRLLDPRVVLEAVVDEGGDVAAGETVARVRGPARAILTGERTALNFLAHLSGVATATRDMVAAIHPHPARVVCTRKTTPGLRVVEKYAVRVGGGLNHRFGLSDGVLIKDNHRAVLGSLREAVARVRETSGHMVKIEVEVDTLAELDEALDLEVDAVLLDNFSLEDLREAVRRVRGKVLLEASGGLRPETAQEVAASGVHLLSVGWITHSAPALDVALELEPAKSPA